MSMEVQVVLEKVIRMFGVTPIKINDKQNYDNVVSLKDNMVKIQNISRLSKTTRRHRKYRGYGEQDKKAYANHHNVNIYYNEAYGLTTEKFLTEKIFVKNNYEKTGIYIKDDLAYINININVKQAPLARVLTEYILGLLDVAYEFADFLGIELNEPQIKINIQSPGYFKLIGKITTIFIIALVFIGICGGELKCNLETGEFDIKTEGLIKQIVYTYKQLHNIDNFKKIEKLQEVLVVEKLEVDNN